MNRFFLLSNCFSYNFNVNQVVINIKFGNILSYNLLGIHIRIFLAFDEFIFKIVIRLFRTCFIKFSIIGGYFFFVDTTATNFSFFFLFYNFMLLHNNRKSFPHTKFILLTKIFKSIIYKDMFKVINLNQRKLSVIQICQHS